MLQVSKVLRPSLEDKVGTKYSAHNDGYEFDQSNYVEHTAELADVRKLQFEAVEKVSPPDLQHANTDLAA